MWADKIHSFLYNPITGIVVAILLAVLAASGRFNMNLSNFLLVIAFLVGCFGILHSGYALHPKIIFCLLFGIVLTLLSWWIYPKHSELFNKNFLGVSFQTLIKLTNVSASENHRKYIFDLGQIKESRLSLYISPDGIFTYSLLDARGEQHHIKAPIGNGGVPFGKFFYLLCEIGIDGQSTVMRMMIDGKEFKSDRIPFKVDMGAISVRGGAVGADLNGENCASFDMVRLMVLSTTMTTPQAIELKKTMDEYVYANPHSAFIEYNGKQWMRFNKSGFSDLSQDNKLFQPTWRENK
jgi:hypothetical protein